MHIYGKIISLIVCRQNLRRGEKKKKRKSFVYRVDSMQARECTMSSDVLQFFTG